MDFLDEEDEVDDPADPDFTPMHSIKRKKKRKYVFRSSKGNAQEDTSSDGDSSDNSSENDSNLSSSESASDSQPPRKMFALNNSICNNDVAVQRNPTNAPNQAITSLEVEATPQLNGSSVTNSINPIPTKTPDANESRAVNNHGTSSEDTDLTILENVPIDQKSARALNNRRIKRNRELKKTLILKSFKTITKQSVILKSFLVANKKLIPEDSDNLPLCGVGLEMNRTLEKEEIFLLYGKIQDPVYNYAIEKSLKDGTESETKDYIAPMVLKVANIALNSNSSLKLVKSFLKARVLLDNENETVLLTLYPITKNQAFHGVNESSVDEDNVVGELPDNVTSTTGLSDSEDSTQPTENTDGKSTQQQVAPAVDSSCYVEPPSTEGCEEVDILTLSDDEPLQTVNIVPRKVVKYQRHNRTEPVVRKTKDKSLIDHSSTDVNQTILEEPSNSNEIEENLPNDDTGPIIRIVDEDPVFFQALLSDKTGNMGKGINLLSVTKLALISSEVNSTHTDNPNNDEVSNELKLAAEAALERVGPCIVRRIKLKNGNVVYVYKAAGLMPPNPPNNSNSSITKDNSSPATTNQIRNDETPKTVNSNDTSVSHKGDDDGVLNKSPKKARPGPKSVKEKRKEREKNRKMSPTDAEKLSTCTSNTSISEETSNHSKEKIQNSVYYSSLKDTPQSSLVNKPNSETNVAGKKEPLRRGRSTKTSNDLSMTLPEIHVASTSRIPESGSHRPLPVTGSSTEILAMGSVPQTPRLVSLPQTPRLVSMPQTPRLVSMPQTPRLVSLPQTPRLVSLPQIPQIMGVQFPIGSALPNVQGGPVEGQGMCLVNNMDLNAANWLSTENAPFIMMMVPAGSTLYNSTESQPLTPTIISCESISEQQYKNDILDVVS